MNRNRSRAHQAAGTGLTALLLAGLACLIAGTAAAAGLPAGIRILDPDQVLSERAMTGSDGLLYLQDREGVLRRFVTSTEDPAVSNPGDGSFHPLPVASVERALTGVDVRFLEQIGFDIYLLPYPVVEPMGSWAGERTIYLSPGVYELAEEQILFLVGHEFGHLVHRAFLPDEDLEGWARYRSLRGIEDSTMFYDTAPHANRPREIFAEDFRVLFSAPRGAALPPIENRDLPQPDLVPGLREFFVDLIGGELIVEAAETARFYPNPLRAGDLLTISIPTSSSAVPDAAIFDVTGRRVRELRGLRAGEAGRFDILWDGRDDAGRLLDRGVYFCKLSGAAGESKLSFCVVD